MNRPESPRPSGRIAGIDYGTKRLGIDGALMPTGDEKADWDAIRAFYAPMHGKRPGRFVLPRNGLD